MAVRNCKEIGENLQKIMTRLLANDDLVKLLYYNDKDPLSKTALTDAQKQSLIFEKLIKVVPIVRDLKSEQSVVAIKVDSGLQDSENNEFRTIHIAIEVIVPLNTWILKNSNLRPFLILGAIQESLNNKTVNGLGKMMGGDFALNYITEEVACYEATYEIITYD